MFWSWLVVIRLIGGTITQEHRVPPEKIACVNDPEGARVSLGTRHSTRAAALLWKKSILRRWSLVAIREAASLNRSGITFFYEPNGSISVDFAPENNFKNVFYNLN